MLRRTALALLLCTATLVAAAQTDTPSASDRLTQWAQALSKNPRDVEALVGLAQFYFDNSNPMRNLPTAARYAEQAEVQHAALLNDDRIKELHRLGRIGIDLGYIRQLRRAIDDAALQNARVRTDMTLPEVELYLAQFGTNADLAKLLRARKLQLTYRQAMQQGSTHDLYQFALQYDGTAEAVEAESRLATLLQPEITAMQSEASIDSLARRYPASQAVAKAAADRKSQIAYRQAEQEGTLKAYLRYVAAYPASNESERARQQIDRLTEQDLARRRTAEALIHFADSNADSPLADRALARLRKLIYRTHDVQAAHHYVHHYPFDAHRNEVYSQYYSWYATEGNGQLIATFAEQNPDFPFRQALEDDLARGEEIDLLPLATPYDDSLYLDYEEAVRSLMGKGIALVGLQRMLQSPLRTRNYAAALELSERFELVFDNAFAPHYRALVNLLRTPNPKLNVRAEHSSTASLRHPCYNPADQYLYFTDSTHLLRIPRKASARATADTLRIDGLPNTTFALFGFYNNGQGMLLGIDGDIWMAQREGDSWRISELPPYPVNTDYAETDAQILPDGSGILLASDRPGGYNLQPSRSNYHGDTALATDLYFIPRTSYGWGNPINLGPTINTAYCERHPLLSRNMRTLYFISDAPGGLGYGDIYVSTRQEGDSWTSWSRPKHLGREANSPWREADLAFDAGESRLLYSTNEGGNGYQLRSCSTTHNTRSGSRQHTVSLGEASEGLVGMQIADLDDQSIAQSIDLGGGDSTFSLLLDRNRRYALMARSTDRFVSAIVIDSASAPTHRLPAYTFEQLVASDREIALPTVGRAGDSDELLPMGMQQLDEVVRFAQKHPRCKIEIAVDNPSTDAAKAYAESQRTAEAVGNYLMRSGLEPQQILLSPYGNARYRRTRQQGVSIRFRE